MQRLWASKPPESYTWPVNPQGHTQPCTPSGDMHCPPPVHSTPSHSLMLLPSSRSHAPPSCHSRELNPAPAAHAPDQIRGLGSCMCCSPRGSGKSLHNLACSLGSGKIELLASSQAPWLLPISRFLLMLFLAFHTCSTDTFPRLLP